MRIVVITSIAPRIDDRPSRWTAKVIVSTPNPNSTESVGCKWSLTVLALVRRGVNRPGAMEHAVRGLSAKVLNERLRKLQRFGILERTSFPEVLPRVEYSLTPFGARFIDLVDRIEALEAELQRGR